jgi:hypothetical protein
MSCPCPEEHKRKGEKCPYEITTYEEYENDESREITRFLQEARQKLIDEDGMPPDCLLPLEKVVFIREVKK